MANKKLTIDDLGMMIKKGFDENTKEHQQISKILDKHAVILIDHTERLKRMETKLEGIVYREEFEELAKRLKRVEVKLGIK